MSEGPEFSLIIPVCHGGALLRDALASVRRLKARRAEVLVVGADDDAVARGCVDGSAACDGIEMRYLSCGPADPPTRSAMLNAAWREARGRVLAFTDDDCVLPPDWLAGLAAGLEGGARAGIVGGPDAGAAGGAFDAALDWVLQSLAARVGFRGGARAGMGKYYPRLWNMAVPSDVARAVAIRADGAPPQLFDESLAVHEDVELADRIERSGRRIAFAPAARVMHARDTTFGALLRRNFGMARACRRLGVHRMAHRALAASVVGAVALAGLAVFLPATRIALAACAGAYAVLVLACAAAAAAATRRAAVALHVVPILVGLHVARGVGYMVPLPRGRRHVGKGAKSWPG